MSDSQNPYEGSASSGSANSGVITETMARWLIEASPWLRFLGVMGFISVGLLAVSGLVFMIMGPALSSLGGDSVPFGGGMGVVLGFVYIAMGVLYVFPARFIWNFGTRIKSWKETKDGQDLEKALESNKSLWKFSGILMIICLASLPVSLVIGVSGALMSAM